MLQRLLEMYSKGGRQIIDEKFEGKLVRFETNDEIIKIEGIEKMASPSIFMLMRH